MKFGKENPLKRQVKPVIKEVNIPARPSIEKSLSKMKKAIGGKGKAFTAEKEEEKVPVNII